MAEEEPFTLIPSAKDGNHQLFPRFYKAHSAKYPNLDVQLVTELRRIHPELTVTTVSEYDVPLLKFAAAGHADATLDTDHEGAIRWRTFFPPRSDHGEGALGEDFRFAKYHYRWAGEDFILYVVRWETDFSLMVLQYILKEPGNDEPASSNSKVTDSLLLTAGKWSSDIRGIYVYDGYWYKDQGLYRQVQKASWENVILDAKMKKELTEVVNNFFDGKHSESLRRAHMVTSSSQRCL
jgi:transitional endoplasmic reticulum ATPase